jgi:MFS family permease
MTFSLLAAAVLASAFLIGLVPTVVDGIKKPLQDRLSLSEGRVAWFVRLFYVAWLPAMPLAGWMLDSWPFARQILFFGQIGVILGFTWIALAKSAASLQFGAAFLGLAYSCVTTATVHLMTAVFFPDEPDIDKLHAASLCIGFVAVGSGALVGPWFAAAIERWWGCRQGLLYVSVLCILPAALTAFCESALFAGPPAAASRLGDLITYPHLALIAGAILLYFAIETCLDFWPDAYLKELRYQPGGRRVATIIFWLAFIATRAAAAWWFYQYPGHGLAVTIGLLIASAIILGNLTTGYMIGGGSLGFWLVGACYGPLLPGLLGVVLDLTARPLPATLLGALLALCGLDTLLVRPLMSRFGRGRAARSVMCVPTVLAILLAAPLLLLAFL